MSILNNKFLLLGLLLIIGWLGISSWQVHQQAKETAIQVQDIQKKINSTERENDQLRKMGDYVQSADFMERQARLQLNYKDADEQVAFVYNTTASSQAQTSIKRNGFAKITHWLYNFFNNKKD